MEVSEDVTLGRGCREGQSRARDTGPAGHTGEKLRFFTKCESHSRV